jgi:hypothetical protein
LDEAWEKRGYAERFGPNVQLVRYADDLVLLTDKDACWALARLREILGELELELNEEKSRVVDAEKETFDFLGFTYRRVTNPKTGKRAALFYPSQKAQKRLREKVKNILNPHYPIAFAERIRQTNRVVRGWVNYFRVGNSSRVFHDIRHHVEMKVRRVLQCRQGRYGRGWHRYRGVDLSERLGLYSDYRVRWSPS